MNYSVFGLSKLLFFVAISDFMIGGGGRWLMVGPLSARMIVFGWCLLMLLVYLQSSDSEVKKITLFSIILSCSIMLFYGGIGIYCGASIGDVFSDSNFLLTFFYVPVFYVVLRRVNEIYAMSNYSIFLALLIALVTVGLVLLHFLDFLNINGLGKIFQSYGYGGVVGMYKGGIPRVFFISQVFILLGTSLLLARTVVRGKRGVLLRFMGIALLCLALLLTNTRGLWLGFVVSLLALGFLTKNFLKAILIGCFLASLMSFFLIASGVYTIDSIGGRASKVDKSDIVKVLQTQYAFNQWIKSPVFGQGFGLKMPVEYYKFRNLIQGTNIELAEESRVSIELTYVDMLRKLGVVGVLSFSLLVLYLIIKARNVLGVLKFKNIKLYETLLGYLSFFMAFLVVSATNPYLLNASGAFVLSILMVFLMVTTKFIMVLRRLEVLIMDVEYKWG